jgi:hypothetical protein
MSARTRLPRLCGYAVSAIRLTFSVLFAAAPAAMMTEMFGSAGEARFRRLAARHYVLRDFLLGVGLLRALRSGRNARRWMLAGTIADMVDLGTIAVTQPDKAKRVRLLGGMTVIVATDAVLSGLLRDDERPAAH